MAKKNKAKKVVAKKSPVKKAQAKKSKIKKTVKKSKPVKKVVKNAAKKTTKKIVKPAVQVKAVKIKTAQSVDYGKAITPLMDRIVVKPVSTNETMTKGGIILLTPDAAMQGFNKAEVLAVGSGMRSKKGHIKKLDVQVGDLVLYPNYAGTPIKFNNEDLVILTESDVLGITQ